MELPEEKPKRKHVATGKKPPGGARPGAGRPPGTDNAGLPPGAIGVLRGLRHRVPEGTPPLLADLADESLEGLVEVMRNVEQMNPQAAMAKLKAIGMFREEVCGPVKQRLEVAGEGGGALVVQVVKEGA